MEDSVQVEAGLPCLASRLPTLSAFIIIGMKYDDDDDDDDGDDDDNDDGDDDNVRLPLSSV